MAVATGDVLDDGGVLLVEAGTGTGKTLAYLVPAILSGQRVLISTGTRNLQDQIFYKDLPALRDALDVDFSATYMKGRGNYLCLHRFEARLEDDASAPRLLGERSSLEAIREWAETTKTGDRAEIEDLPDDLPLWHDISASSENCVGTDCPRFDDCYVTRMRRQAMESDLVIVNHHLLCADASVRQSAYGEVIPSCRDVIIDEAHQLEDVATQYFGVVVSSYRVDELARDTHQAMGTGTSSSLAFEVRRRADEVAGQARRFFDELSRLGRDGSRQAVTVESLAAVGPPGDGLRTALTDLQQGLGQLPESSEDTQSLGRRAGEIRDQLTFLLEAADPAFVYFLEVRGRGVFLRAAPIDVSAIVREHLLDRHESAVLTSATLTVDGSFDYLRQRLGLSEAHELRLPSEFDYRRQAILYLPPSMPEPRDATFSSAVAAELRALLALTRGRAFVLFTSYANLRQVHDLLAPRVPYPLLVQGSSPRSVLLREFRTTPEAVLLATSSFWQGVDVVGEALSCVVIDKLPFASPGDPITAARMAAVDAAGGQAFADYQVPLAILALLQGFGRLIRHREDRGVLALLDARIRTKRYGQRFLSSLPPVPITQSRHDVRSFLQRDTDA